MQLSFDFGSGGALDGMLSSLRSRVRQPRQILERLEPVGELARSLVGSRTYDHDSKRAFSSLVERYPNWSDVAEADPREIEAAINPATFPDVKARQLKSSLAAVRRTRPDFDLAFLGARPVPSALTWLEQLEGVGRKIAASVLNFSTLNRPAFVVDAHVLRVLIRLGFVGKNANTYEAYDFVMRATPGWRAADYAEFHLLLKLLGQHVCRDRRPLCQHCPFRQGCPRIDAD